MKHLKKFNEINEGKISQFALKTIMVTLDGINRVIKMIKGTHIPLKTKDKKLSWKITNDIFEVFDYAVFDTIKYYISKKFRQEAQKTNLTTLIKQRCGVDVYQKINSILSNVKKENFILSTDPELLAKQEAEIEKIVDTVKKMKGMLKKVDDDIAETNELIDGLKDIMKDLDPRNPDNLFRDKEETLDVLDKSLGKIDKMQNPDKKHLDDLLDKVAEYGINSLTDREKEDLEKHSKQEGMKHIKKF